MLMSETIGSAPHIAGLNLQVFSVCRVASYIERVALLACWISATEPSVRTVMATVVSPIRLFWLADFGYIGSGVFTGIACFMSAHCRRSIAPFGAISNLWSKAAVVRF